MRQEAKLVQPAFPVTYVYALSYAIYIIFLAFLEILILVSCGVNLTRISSTVFNYKPLVV
jgi:hypothetical protein